MGDFGGGIPGQVVSELRGIAVDSAKAVVKAGGDIAKGTAETLTASSSQQSAVSSQQSAESGQAQADPMAAIKQQKDVAAKGRLAEVRGELQAYYEEKKRKEKQEEQVAEEQKREELQIKESKKKQEEKQILGRLSRQYGGTGEIGKSGN